MRIESGDDEFCVDAALLAPLLNVSPAEVPGLVRSGAITAICERGVEDDAGRFRLSFFYGNRRVRISVDRGGKVLQRSSVDFGEQAPPRPARRLRRA